jgi:signal transduction histidine kinase/ligand-binding sensor domain-containing protein
VTVSIAALPLMPSPAAAQSANATLHYSVWTTDQGLPQGSVRQIAQTPDGYLWIATFDGVVRFDGVRMVVFSRPDTPGMTSNRCVSLIVDRRGTVWVATEDGGVLQIVGTRVRAFGRADGLESDALDTLAEDPAGRIWARTGAGPAVFDGDRWKPAAPPLKFPEPFPIPHELQAFLESHGKADRRSLAWTRNANGRLWVFLDGYLHRREPASASGHRSLGGGVWTTFNPPPSVVLPAPSAMFEDREGNLWLGGDRGLVQATPTAVRALVPDALVQRNIYTLAEDSSGRVWIGPQAPSLLWERGTFTSLATQSWWPNAAITSIQPDDDGSILAGGPGRIFRVHPGRGFETLSAEPGSHVSAFLRDRRRRLWVATGRGLLRQSEAGWEHIEGLPSSDLKVLLETRDGAVWAGMYGGLARLTDGHVQAWTTRDGLPSDRIRALHEDETGALWIGTYDGGLIRFAGGRFVSIEKRDGLFDNGAFVILDGGDGRYYMSSNRGIYSVARRELDAFASGAVHRVNSRAYRSADGMPSSECNGGLQPAGFRAADGTLWFPTQGGIAVVDPRAVGENPVPPPVVVEEVTTDRRTIPLGEPIDLQPGERRLEVRYTANTFVRPEGARFRHRLVGYEEDWVESGSRRFAQYAYIPPGHYTLRILAANSDGVWTPEGLSVAIRVAPYWWQTRWFRWGAGLLVLGAFAGLYRRRVSALEKRRVEQDLFARRLLESQEAERKRIAHELHDGIGQTLAVIRNRALLGLRDGADPALLRQMSEISTVAGEAIEEVRKVSYGLRPYQIDRLGLKRALEALVEQADASSGIAMAAQVGEIDSVLAPEDEIHVYRIVQEAVSNMVRHAGATMAEVEVVVRDEALELRIHDNGVGFDTASAPGGRGGLGLTGIAERARILGGRATIRSSPGQGTAVIVSVPRRSPS